MGMTSGDYVFLYINPEEPTDAVLDAITTWESDDGENAKARSAFENLLVVRIL